MGNTNRQNIQSYSCCYHQDQNLIKKDLLKFIKQFNKQIWYTSFQKIIQQTQFYQSDLNRYTHNPPQSQYDQANLNQEQSIIKSPNKFENYTYQQKIQALKQLMDKSYMVLDWEELPDYKILLNYSTQKHLQIQQQSVSAASVLSILSIHQSQDSRQKKISKLKNFDADILKFFDKFVNFCSDIKQFSQTQNNFICRIILNFKGDLLSQYKSKTKAKTSQNNKKLKQQFQENINSFVYALQQSLIMIYNINRIAQKQQENTFFTDVNIHTFLVSLLFSDSVFYILVYDLYKITLKNMIQLFQTKQNLRKSQISTQFRLDESTINFYRNYGRFSYDQRQNIKSLFKPYLQSEQSYYKCVKILQKIFKFNQPILKMKIVYQTSLQIQKQIKQFYKKNGFDNQMKILDAQKFLQIAFYILKKITNQYIVIDFMIINDFIHEYYKNTKKGCFFAPFFIACQGPTK